MGFFLSVSELFLSHSVRSYDKIQNVYFSDIIRCYIKYFRTRIFLSNVPTNMLDLKYMYINVGRFNTIK